MSELKSGIYKITINDYYIYVGQSVDVKSRWSAHLTELKQNKKSYNKKFQSVFNKYSDKIKFEVVEYCDVDKLDEREMYWIGYYRSFNTKHGLNMNLGGDSNRKYKTKEEAEVAALEKQREYYKTHKEEIKQWSKEYRKTHKEEFKQYHKEYHKTHKEEFKQYHKEYRYGNIEYCKQYDTQRRRQRGILSWKEKFEIRYNLSRPLTNREWDIWCNTKNKGKCYAIKFLNTLPNITFLLKNC